MNKKEYKALTIPKLNWDNKTLTECSGELTAQPLEPGFGMTFGALSCTKHLGGYRSRWPLLRHDIQPGQDIVDLLGKAGAQ